MKKISVLLLFFSSLYCMCMEKKYLLYKNSPQYGTMQKKIIKQKKCWEDENCWQDCDKKVVFPTAAACGSGFYSWVGTMALFTLCGVDVSVFGHIPCFTSCAVCTFVGGCAAHRAWRKRDLEIER